jgi:hypothetical protein
MCPGLGGFDRRVCLGEGELDGTTRSGVDCGALAVSGVAAPDSPLIAGAMEYARAQYSVTLFNHVIRSWLFAVRIARSARAKVDDDVIGVSVLLHDLGLLASFDGPDRFEVNGANAARGFARERGVDERRAQLIWDSVALHAIPSIHRHKEREVAVCGAGIALDHGGAGIETFPPEDLAVILDAFPRLELKRALKTCFCRLAETKPPASAEGLVRDFGERFILGHQAASAVDFIMNAPFEE